ncbi:MAG: hypothetical protein IBJ11_02930 [Phycisphaerales bacterium]|nr:hypothetical protein [Phycisphaerales bacterium]
MRINRAWLAAVACGFAAAGAAIAGDPANPVDSAAPPPPPASTGPIAPAPASAPVLPSRVRAAVETQPASVGAGQAATIVIRLTDAEGEPATADRSQGPALLVYIASADLRTFDVLEAREREGGRFDAPVSFPRAGVHTAFIAFRPEGREAQIERATVPVQPRSTDRAESPVVRPLEPGDNPFHQDDHAIRFTPSESGLKAGAKAVLTFEVTAGGRPVTTIEGYLGGVGHAAAAREGLEDFVVLKSLQREGATGGPVLAFEGVFPAQGRYKLGLWLRDRGERITAWFVVDVGPAEEAKPTE